MNTQLLPSDLLGTSGQRPGGPRFDRDAIEVRALARTFWRRRWLLFGAMLLAAVGTYLAVAAIPPTYTAQAKLILDPRRVQIVDTGNVVSDLEPSEQILNGEIAVLTSNDLLADVVREIGPEALRPVDPAARPPGLADRALTLVGLRGGDEAASPPADPAARERRLVWAVKSRLQVTPVSNSYVIVVRAETPDPELSAQIANTVAANYVDLQLDARRDAVGQATAWLEERVTALQQDVEEAEAAVANFRAESLLEDGGTLENASSQIADLNSQLVNARTERLSAQADYDQLRRVVDEEGAVRAARIVSSAPLEDLRRRELELRQQDAIWAEDYPPDHPRRLDISREQERIEQEIADEVGQVLDRRRSALEVARLRERSLQESIGELETKVISMTRNGLGLRQLERQAEAARRNYESLLTRVTETRTQQQFQQPDAKVIEAANVPGRPSAPRPRLAAALSGTLALGAVAAWIFVMEMTATTFRTAREVEAETGLPVLASVPRQRGRDMRTVLDTLRTEPYSVYAERMRELRTSVMMRDADEAPQAILVLSSLPGEGKTTTTLALAEIVALSGKRVIVVDLDLRRSTMHRNFGWAEETDLADYILGRCDLVDALGCPDDRNFDVLAAAGNRSDAAEKLSARMLLPMLDVLKRAYDVVLIDAPALLALSDAMVIAQVVDSRLYVVRHDSTTRAQVRAGLNKLREMRLGATGIVLNGIDPREGEPDYAEGYV